MSSSQESLNVDKIDPLSYYLQLIYIAILSLEIDSKLTVIPQNKIDLNFVISSLMKIIRKNDDLIHRAVSLWEEIENLDSENNYYGIVEEYLVNFTDYAQNHPKFKVNLDSNEIPSIAFKILTDLLFYSSISGEKLLRDKLEKLFKPTELVEENDGV